MRLSRIGRVIVALAALLFAGVGLVLWVVPEQVAHRRSGRIKFGSGG